MRYVTAQLWETQWSQEGFLFTKIQLQFCAAECMLCASMLMSEEAFSSWTSKPWPLRPRPVPNTSVDMASQLVQHVRNALDDLYMGSFDSDLGSLMQKPAIKNMVQ